MLAAIAVAVGVAVFRPAFSPAQMGAFRNSIASQAGKAAASLKAAGSTVAQILESRSPGERSAGALASLKPRRQAAIHERALPKVRGPIGAVVPAAIPPAAAPVAAAPVTATPLYNIVSGQPVVPPPTAAPPATGGPPIIFPGSPGGVILPPFVSQPPQVTPAPVTTPQTPPPVVAPPAVTPPVTPPETPPAVPEPASWAMMLIGFTMIGAVVRRERPKRPPVT
jgi:hypothetical protein